MEHYDTAPGLPQTKAEVEALDDEGLDAFMARCHVEPADFDGCLACYAYWVAQMREAAAKPAVPENSPVVFSSHDLRVEAEPNSGTVAVRRVGSGKLVVRLTAAAAEDLSASLAFQAEKVRRAARPVPA